jgi:hypothetical protein
MVPSFISIIAPTILRKGLPKIIGQEALHLIYKKQGNQREQGYG